MPKTRPARQDWRMTRLRDIDLSFHNWAMEKKGDEWRISLGNLTDAGWFWHGDEKELAGFIIRLASSEVKDEFLEAMEDEGINFELMKDIILQAAEEGDGVYMVTGDNSIWHFGNIGEPEIDLIHYGLDLDEEQADEFQDYYYWNANTRDAVDFDEFSKSPYYKKARNLIVEGIKEAEDWDEVLRNMNLVREEASNEAWDYIREAVENEVFEQHNNWLKCKEEQKAGKNIDCRTGKENV